LQYNGLKILKADPGQAVILLRNIATSLFKAPVVAVRKLTEEFNCIF